LESRHNTSLQSKLEIVVKSRITLQTEDWNAIFCLSSHIFSHPLQV
jgi:hypothetical protein